MYSVLKENMEDRNKKLQNSHLNNTTAGRETVSSTKLKHIPGNHEQPNVYGNSVDPHHSSGTSHQNFSPIILGSTFCVVLIVVLIVGLVVANVLRKRRRHSGVSHALYNKEEASLRTNLLKGLDTNINGMASIKAYSEDEISDKTSGNKSTDEHVDQKIPLPDHGPKMKGDPADSTKQKIQKYLDTYHSTENKLDSDKPVNYSDAQFSVGKFGEKGGFLELKNFDVSLFIPQGALPGGSVTEIFLYVSWENTDLPEMTQPQCPVGPVIWCGQHGTKFSQHVILSFPQLVKFAGTSWTYQVMRCDTGLHESNNWTNVTSNPDNCTILIGHKCLLLVDHFTGHSVTALAEPGVIRTVQVGVFGGKLLFTDDIFNFKVGFWSGNPQFNGQEKLLDDARFLNIVNNQLPLCIKISKVCQGWEVEDMEEELPFSHIWGQFSDSCTFRAVKLEGNTTGTFYFTAEVYQKDTKEDGTHRKFKPLVKMEEQPMPPPSVQRCNSQAEEVFYRTEPRLQVNERLIGVLPVLLAQELSVELDVKHPQGKDWRLLAELTGLPLHVIRWIEGQTASPTLTTLNIIASMYRHATCWQIKELLKKMGHTAGVAIVNSYIGVDTCCTQPKVRASSSSLVDEGVDLHSPVSPMTNAMAGLNLAAGNDSRQRSGHESGYGSPKTLSGEFEIGLLGPDSTVFKMPIASGSTVPKQLGTGDFNTTTPKQVQNSDNAHVNSVMGPNSKTVPKQVNITGSATVANSSCSLSNHDTVPTQLHRTTTDHQTKPASKNVLKYLVLPHPAQVADKSLGRVACENACTCGCERDNKDSTEADPSLLYAGLSAHSSLSPDSGNSRSLRT